MYTRIKELREERHLTQKDLAEILEMQLTQYRRYENGERPVPFDFVVKLADFYGVTLDYIAGRSEDTAAEELDNIG